MDSIRNEVQCTDCRNVYGPSLVWANYCQRLVGAFLLVFAFVMGAASVVSADVDTMGQLREVPSGFKSLTGEVTPLTTTVSENYECTAKYSDLQAGAFTWVIGNCPKGGTLEAVVRRLHSDSEPNGDYSLGGWVAGEFQGCGWIEDGQFKPKAKGRKPVTACSEIASGSYEVAESLFISKHNSGAGDGYFVVNKTPCPEYANYRPWSTSNVETGPIRTALAYATSGVGSSYPALKWRYTTKYNSTDGTGQYVMVRDDSVSAGEGNWVFVPRSCLPGTLPENENERVPSKPVVTTSPASSVQTPNATLNGNVNPEGVPTTYYFQYGTTTNWNESSTSPIEIGSGTTSLYESATVGSLASGVTYYYRIVATSATGTSVGDPREFITQPPPQVSTSAAAELTEEAATINGTVDPEGLDTHYNFDYGTTTGYGSSIPVPEGDAGSGVINVPESSNISGLKPGTLYHYKIVATNSAGTSESGDREFRTPGSIRSVVYNGGGSLEYSAWNGKEWEYVPLNHAITGSPSAGVDATDQLFAYYNGGTSLEQSSWTGSEWGYVPLHHAISGNPAVAVNAAGDQYAFYNGGGSLEYTGWNGKEWEYVPLHHAITGSPSVGIDAANHLHVFYNGGGSLEYSGWNGKEWEYIPLHHAITGSPAVGVDAEGEEWVFYNGGGSLEESYWNGHEWGYVPLHHGIVGSPSVAVDSAGEQFVVYNGGVSLEESVWNGKEWEYIPLHHAIAGNPSIVINPHTREQWIFYNGGVSLEESAWNGKEWEYVPLHHAITGNPVAVANTGNLE